MKTIKKSDHDGLIDFLTTKAKSHGISSNPDLLYNEDLVIEYAQEVETDDDMPEDIDENVLFLGYLQWIGSSFVNCTEPCDDWFINDVFIYYALAVKFPEKLDLCWEYKEALIDADYQAYQDIKKMEQLYEDFVAFEETCDVCSKCGSKTYNGNICLKCEGKGRQTDEA